MKEKAAKGWQFNFMGVGIDAYYQGARMGIAPSATVAYDHRNPAATHAVFTASAQSARRFADGAAPTTAYAPAEKAAAGDRFAGSFAGLFSSTPTSGKTDTTARRGLKRTIVDDITL